MKKFFLLVNIISLLISVDAYALSTKKSNSVINLRKSNFNTCNIEELNINNKKCRSFGYLNSSYNYIPLNGNYGIVVVIEDGDVIFFNIGTGKLFAFEHGGFCMETPYGNHGYEWYGTHYILNNENTKLCPLGKFDNLRERWK